MAHHVTAGQDRNFELGMPRVHRVSAWVHATQPMRGAHGERQLPGIVGARAGGGYLQYPV